MSCRAYSLHTADFSVVKPPFNIYWDVSEPAVITDGQNAPTVTVETVSSVPIVTFRLTCTITDSTGYSVVYEKEFSHLRVVLDNRKAIPYQGRPYKAYGYTFQNSFYPPDDSLASAPIKCNNNPIFEECPDMPGKYMIPLGDSYDTYCVMEQNTKAQGYEYIWECNTLMSAVVYCDNPTKSGEQTILSVDNGGMFKLGLIDGKPFAKIKYANPQNLRDEKTGNILRNVQEITLTSDEVLNDSDIYHIAVFSNSIGGRIELAVNGSVKHYMSSLNVDFYLEPIFIDDTSSGYWGVGDDITQRGLNDSPVTPFEGKLRNARLIGNHKRYYLRDPDSTLPEEQFIELFQESEALSLYLEKNVCLQSAEDD